MKAESRIFRFHPSTFILVFSRRASRPFWTAWNQVFQRPALQVSNELCIVNLKCPLLLRNKYRRWGKVSTECVCLPYNLQRSCGRFVKAEQERGAGFPSFGERPPGILS